MARPKLQLLVTELSLGGAARVVRDQADLFDEAFDVHQMVFNAADGVDYPGRLPISLDVDGGGGPLRKIANFGHRVARLRRVKRELGIDLSISHLTGAHFVDILSRRREKIILCVHGSILHNRLVQGLGGSITKTLLPLLYNRADRVVTVSRGLVAELVSLGVRRERIRTIHNFFDAAGIRAKAAEPLTAQEEAVFAGDPVLVTAGRHHQSKNLAALIDVFAQVRRRVPARLVLIGDGPLRDGLVAQAQGLGLATWTAWSGAPLHRGHDVYFLGFQANPFKYLRRGSLFLLTSSWEGLPMVIGEAMACGLPILATDCFTGPREFLAPASGERPAEPLRRAERGEGGVLLPLLDGSIPRDPAVAVWAETIVTLLGDPAERERLAGRAALRVEDFSRERIAAQWLALIDELLQPGSPNAVGGRSA